MTASDSTSQCDFRAFLVRVSHGKVSASDWNRHAVTHYADAQLERVRRELVRSAILCGQCSVEPVQGDLAAVAERLLAELGD